MNRKIYLIVLLVLCQSISLMAQDKNVQAPYLTKSLASAGIKKVYARTSGGSIAVSGAGTTEARVEVYVNGNNGRDNMLSKEEIDKRIKEDYDLTITDTNGELNVVAKSKHSFNWNNNGLSISFKIYVPKAVTTDVSTSGGSIRMDNLTGEQKFSTSGGSLKVDHLVGSINGKTSGGSIQADNCSKDINLQTSGGSVSANNCDGTINLSTSGGSIRLNGLKGTINATTSGGSVSGAAISGELITGTSGGSISLNNLSCSLNANTSAGSLHAQFAQLGKYVKLHVSAGSVTLQVPQGKGLDLALHGMRVNVGELTNFSGTKEDDSVNGKLNGGGIPVQVEAGSGRVSFSQL